MHDDVGAVLDRAAEVRGGGSVVDDERHAVPVGDVGDAGNVDDVVLRVGEGLAEEGLGVVLHRRGPGIEVVGIVDERDGDAHLGEGVVEQVEGAAVQGCRGDDVVAGFADRQDRKRLSGLAGRNGERTGNADGRLGAALECRHPSLEDALGRVHDAGVDVAHLGEREEVRCVLGAVERERRRLVDRHGSGVGGAIGLLSGVDLGGLELPGIGHGRDGTQQNMTQPLGFQYFSGKLSASG